jgi:hypothetical protein
MRVLVAGGLSMLSQHHLQTSDQGFLAAGKHTYKKYSGFGGAELGL